MKEPKSQRDCDRKARRRLQVLDAAAECFRREGLHGSSIARISRAAGMSAGHIYHYFENKEAIVEAIAVREQANMDRLVKKLERQESGNNVSARLARYAAEALERSRRPEAVGLMLELAAEAARNPTIADALQRTDQAIGKRFVELVRREGHLTNLSVEGAWLRMSMIAALMQGLSMRSVIDPRSDRVQIAQLLSRVIDAMLDDSH
ncbi:TetR/AcrR family transcriptional regulator [Stenotrophomonas maltophilia]|uniref:TetR/AcrR family transcriptional regulator n=1 Tax=Stenotrophomonas maltophilia TaxID=40324 RepID=UPI003BF7F495